MAGEITVETQDYGNAKAAYDAYGSHASWTNAFGGRMPAWVELPQDTRLHWVAAVRAITPVTTTGRCPNCGSWPGDA